jgi:hypothetical protein
VRQMRGSECGIVAGGISRARLSWVFVCFARARMFLSGGHAPGALADGGGVVGGVEIGGGDVEAECARCAVWSLGAEVGDMHVIAAGSLTLATLT